jgi:hypothetical protein
MSLSRQVGAHRVGSKRRYGGVLARAGPLALAAHAGTNKIRLQGLLSRTRRLRPGHFTLLLIATAAAGRHSKSGSLSFTILGWRPLPADAARPRCRAGSGLCTMQPEIFADDQRRGPGSCRA